MPGIPPTRFAYLGPEGTFAEAALRAIPAASRGTLLPQPSVHAAIEAVRAGDADAAMVPLENSVEGSVASTLDELAAGQPLVITREVLLPVTFALLARPGTDVAAVKTVATHPHAEAQTRRWLRERLPAAEVVFTGSTAGAAVAVAHGEFDAAVAAPIAGAHNRLVALAALRRICADVRYLGSYPRGTPGEPPRLPPGRDDAAFADATAWLARLRRGD